MSSNSQVKTRGYLGERFHPGHLGQHTTAAPLAVLNPPFPLTTPFPGVTTGELDYYQICETFYFMSRVQQAALLIKQRLKEMI